MKNKFLFKFSTLFFSFILCLSIPINIFASTLSYSVKISVESVNIKPNERYKLSTIILPDNATNKKVAWTSSNPSVVTIDDEGNLFGKNIGNATITCTTTDGTNLKGFCTVYVNQLIESVSIDKNLELTTGQSNMVAINISPQNASNKKMTFLSKNNNVASVNENGLVTGNKTGVTEIVCSTTDGSNKKAYCVVTVRQGIQSVVLNKSSVDMTIGMSTQLTASVTPSNAYNKSLNWKSNNPNVAIVDNTGKITAQTIGNTSIVCSTVDGTNITITVYISVSNGKTNSATINKTQNDNKTNNLTNNTTKTSNTVNEETTKKALTEEEFNELYDDIFSDEATDNETKKSDDINQVEYNKKEKAKEIDKILGLRLFYENKKPILLHWNIIDNFSGYEIYISKENDENYILIGEGVIGDFEKKLNEFKTTYSFKIRAFITSEEGEKIFSNYSSPVCVETAPQGIWNKISSFFEKLY